MANNPFDVLFEFIRIRTDKLGEAIEKEADKRMAVCIIDSIQPIANKISNSEINDNVTTSFKRRILNFLKRHLILFIKVTIPVTGIPLWFLMEMKDEPVKDDCLIYEDGSFICLNNILPGIFTPFDSFFIDTIKTKVTPGKKDYRGSMTLTTSRGRRQIRMRLSDSILVEAGADTRLGFNSSLITQKQEFFLKGETFFEIPMRSGNNITIHAGAFNISTDSATLSIKAYADEDIQIALLGGKASVLFKEKHWALSPGQAIILNAATGKLSFKSIDKDAILTRYTSEKYSFTGEELSQALLQAERIFTATIIIEDPIIGKHPYIGFINRELSLDKFLGDLKFSDMNIEYWYDERSRVHLKQKENTLE